MAWLYESLFALQILFIYCKINTYFPDPQTPITTIIMVDLKIGLHIYDYIYPYQLLTNTV